MLHLVSSGTCNLTNSSTVYLTGEGRTFSTPGYPLNPGRGTCGWNITVPPGEFVKVTFWEISKQQEPDKRADRMPHLYPELLVKRFFQIMLSLFFGFLFLHLHGCIRVICFPHAGFS